MHRTGIEDYYITKNNKRMRVGYTTGTCAAAASKAAALMLVSGRTVSAVDIDTPKGIQLNLEVCGKFADDKKSAICTVIKDSGDDPDVTNGMPVCAKVFLTDDGSIKVDGGEGGPDRKSVV